MRSIFEPQCRPAKRQLALAYSINPYRGCEFGCKYCYRPLYARVHAAQGSLIDFSGRQQATGCSDCAR